MRDHFDSLGIPRNECARAANEQHLVAFIDAFVIADSRDRARHLLRRLGWKPAASGLVEQRLDPRHCVWVIEHSRPRQWDARFRGDGIYIADTELGLSMTLSQASALSLASCRDAIYSIVPGALAVFLNHEWGIFYCSTPIRSRGGR